MPSEPRPAWDSSLPGSPTQSLLVALGTVIWLPAIGLSALRIFPPTADAPALVASFVAYGVVGHLVALGCFGAAIIRAPRRRALTTAGVVCLVFVVAHLTWLVPAFVPDQRYPTNDSFRLVSLNVRGGRADPARLVTATQDADVVILLEANRGRLSVLRPYGFRERFPYVVGTPVDGVPGSAIYSRYRLSDPRPTYGSFRQWAATAEVPGLGPVRIHAVHPCNPFCGRGVWALEHAMLRSVAREERTGALVLAGDFNAVDDHGPMQALYADGLRSASHVVGAGWVPTYPAGGWLPPLLEIDHVLLGDRLTATSFRRVAVPGTDHLGLVVDIAGS